MRNFVATIAVLCGIAGACAEYRLTSYRPVPNSLEETAFIFDLCIAFYGVTYAVGMLLYLLLGRKTEQHEVAQVKVQHVLALDAFGLLLAIAITTRVPALSVFRPAMLFAIVMLVWSLRNFLVWRRRKKGGS